MKNLSEALALYEKFKDAKTMDVVMHHFKLPDCAYCQAIANVIWASLVKIHSFYYGVEGKPETKYPLMANKQLAILNDKLKIVKDTHFQTIHAELSRVDEFFETTH